MTTALVLLLHLLGFGMVAGATLAGCAVNGRFGSEFEPELKLAVARALRNVALLFHIGAALLLLSGISLIYVEYTGRGIPWLGEAWLVVKVVLFGVLLTNGTVLGPSIARKRIAIVRSVLDGERELLEGEDLDHLNAQMRWHYVVQTLLVVGILSVSLLGSANHVGGL